LAGVIAFVGDVHREFAKLARLVGELPDGVEAVVQVGDLGLHPADLTSESRTATGWSRPLHFIGGNHDHEPWFRGLREPTEICRNLIYVPRGIILRLDQRRLAFLGGGDSIVDRSRRREGIDWWPEEGVTAEDVARLTGAGPVDILVTHTPPAPVYPAFGYPPDPSALEVERAWEMLGRPTVICGHLHRARAVGVVRVLGSLEVLLM
jgi:predicted phosphodiesterase